MAQTCTCEDPYTGLSRAFPKGGVLTWGWYILWKERRFCPGRLSIGTSGSRMNYHALTGKSDEGFITVNKVNLWIGQQFLVFAMCLVFWIQKRCARGVGGVHSHYTRYARAAEKYFRPSQLSTICLQAAFRSARRIFKANPRAIMSKFFLIACLLPCAVQAFFSINYAADESHPKIMTQPGFFKDAPTPDHVADIYSRLSGHAPLLWEGRIVTIREKMHRRTFHVLNYFSILLVLLSMAQRTRICQRSIYLPIHQRSPFCLKSEEDVRYLP
jgi:hypothetical protein